MAVIHPTPLEELLKHNPELKEADIQTLSAWCEKQPHLPKISNSDLAVFLHSNYYRIEPTKATIEAFYTMRTHAPEIFSNRDPLESKELRQAFNVAAHIPLEGETADGYQIIFGRLLDPDPAKYMHNVVLKYWTMVVDLWIREKGTAKGLVVVVDAALSSLGHSARINLATAKKYSAYQQEALPIRLKGVHLINVMPVVDIVMSMMKPFVKKELMDIIHIHTTNDTLAKFVPIELLPNESGGKAGPIQELHQQNIKRLEANRDWFKEIDSTIQVNEALRPGKAKTATDLFGIEGSFKKLDFD